MIYQSGHQAPTMSSTRKTSPRFQHRNLQSSSKCMNSKRKGDLPERVHGEERCRGRCRVQWSEKHVKEGLVLVQETQLARVVKTGPITEHYEIDSKPFARGQRASLTEDFEEEADNGQEYIDADLDQRVPFMLQNIHPGTDSTLIAVPN